MPLCPAGSAPKSGSPAFYTIDQSYIATKFGTIANWFTNWAMGIPSTPQVTADLCAAEPSTDLPTTADYAKLAFPPIALISGTYQRFGNQLRYDKWAELCECNGVPGTYVTCQLDTSGDKTSVGNGGLNVFADPIAIPACADQVTPTWYADSCAGGLNSRYQFGYKTPGGTYVTTENTLISCQDRTGNVLPINRSTMASLFMQSQMDNGVGGTTYHWHGTLNWEQNGGPTTLTPPALATKPTGFPDPPAAPTCASYQDICNTLNTIIFKQDWLLAQINDIQRRKVPFAWISGTPHTGLTGTGSVTVVDALGCIVTLTTVPGGWGSTAETPRRLIPTAGSIQASDGTAYGDWQQLHYEHETHILDAPWATSINYNFRQGFVATLTPIYPVP